MPSWEVRLSELADAKSTGTATFLATAKQLQLGSGRPRRQYKLQQDGKDVVYITFRIQGGNLGFRMGQPQRHLGRAFEGACRLSQNPGTAMFLNLQENIQLGEWHKGQYKVAPRRKTSSTTTFEFRNWKSWISNGTASALPGMSV
jgi:hypothetical protein